MRFAVLVGLLSLATGSLASATEPKIRLSKVDVASLLDPRKLGEGPLRRAVQHLRREVAWHAERERLHSVSAAGSRFAAIATGRYDKTRERIVYRGRGAIGFVNFGDPLHPMYFPEPPEGLKAAREWALQHPEDLEAQSVLLDPSHRLHILLIPQAESQHIAKHLTAPITRADIQRTAALFDVAHDLAATLRLKLKPEVFQNGEGTVTVGYQHLHIIGERHPSVAIPDLDFPNGNRPPPNPR